MLHFQHTVKHITGIDNINIYIKNNLYFFIVHFLTFLFQQFHKH